MRQIEMAGAVARVLRVLLTKHKERQLREATKTSRKSLPEEPRSPAARAEDGRHPISPICMNSSPQMALSGSSDRPQDDDDDLSLQETLPEVIRACRSSRLQLITLAPRLLEDSAHSSNSDVSGCLSEIVS